MPSWASLGILLGPLRNFFIRTSWRPLGASLGSKNGGETSARRVGRHLAQEAPKNPQLILKRHPRFPEETPVREKGFQHHGDVSTRAGRVTPTVINNLNVVQTGGARRQERKPRKAEPGEELVETGRLHTNMCFLRHHLSSLGNGSNGKCSRYTWHMRPRLSSSSPGQLPTASQSSHSVAF